MSRPRVGVLALQGDVAEHLSALGRAGAQPVAVRRPAELADVDALVLPGGESTTIALLLHRVGLDAPLRERLAAGMPAYGSCAGMILLADRVLDGRADQQVLGGIDMTVRRNAFGRQVDSFEAGVEVAALGGPPLRAVFIRAPWVEAVGPGVVVLAQVTATDCATMSPHGAGPTGAARIVAVRQGPLLATSFHPELTGDTRVHGYFVDMVRGEA